MKKIISYILLTIPLFTSGCFTAMRGVGEAWGGGPSSTSEKVETTALDIVTFPVQAPIVVPYFLIGTAGAAAEERGAKAQADAHKQLMPLLEKDPALGLKERWDLKKDLHRWVFIQSFSNPKIKYTDALLEEIHQTCPSIRDCVFSCQSCSKDFLTRHFDEEFERAKNPANQGGLAAIVSNTNTPIDLVEKAASTKEFTSGVILPAEQALSQRSSKSWMEMLIKDPSIALQERWDIKNRPRQLTFQRSFSNPKVKYTPDLLDAIFETCPSMQDDEFLSPYCSSDFLSRHFDEAFEQGRKWPLQTQQRLNAIFRNPNAPIELVEKVAFATNYPGGSAAYAKLVLKWRQSEIQKQPTHKQ